MDAYDAYGGRKVLTDPGGHTDAGADQQRGGGGQPPNGATVLDDHSRTEEPHATDDLSDPPAASAAPEHADEPTEVTAAPMATNARSGCGGVSAGLPVRWSDPSAPATGKRVRRPHPSAMATAVPASGAEGAAPNAGVPELAVGVAVLRLVVPVQQRDAVGALAGTVLHNGLGSTTTGRKAPNADDVVFSTIHDLAPCSGLSARRYRFALPLLVTGQTGSAGPAG
jgi:hypothetical protein